MNAPDAFEGGDWSAVDQYIANHLPNARREAVLKEGFCLFQAASLGLSSHGHELIRHHVVEWIRREGRKNDLIMAAIADSNRTLEQYIKFMAEEDAWGGEPELMIIAELYRVTLVVVQPNSQGGAHERKYGRDDTLVYLAYNGNHYDAIVTGVQLEDAGGHSEVHFPQRSIGKEDSASRVNASIANRIGNDNNASAAPNLVGGKRDSANAKEESWESKFQEISRTEDDVLIPIEFRGLPSEYQWDWFKKPVAQAQTSQFIIVRTETIFLEPAHPAALFWNWLARTFEDAGPARKTKLRMTRSGARLFLALHEIFRPEIIVIRDFNQIFGDNFKWDGVCVTCTQVELTPVAVAILFHDLELLKWLINHGAPIDEKFRISFFKDIRCPIANLIGFPHNRTLTTGLPAEKWCSPLFLSVCCNEPQVCGLLIDKGANVFECCTSFQVFYHSGDEEEVDERVFKMDSIACAIYLARPEILKSFKARGIRLTSNMSVFSFKRQKRWFKRDILKESKWEDISLSYLGLAVYGCSDFIFSLIEISHADVCEAGGTDFNFSGNILAYLKLLYDKRLSNEFMSFPRSIDEKIWKSFCKDLLCILRLNVNAPQLLESARRGRGEGEDFNFRFFSDHELRDIYEDCKV